MVQAVNTYSLPVSRHHAGIINEPKEGREAPDIQGSSSQCTPTPASRGCSLSVRKEAEDKRW